MNGVGSGACLTMRETDSGFPRLTASTAEKTDSCQADLLSQSHDGVMVFLAMNSGTRPSVALC